jgi:hypothetical protein
VALCGDRQLRAYPSSSLWPRFSQAVSFPVSFLPGRLDWPPPSACRFSSLSPRLSQAVSFSVSFLDSRIDWPWTICLPVLTSARGERWHVPRGLSLGRVRSRGPLSCYSTGPPPFQAATTTAAALPAQRLWPSVPAGPSQPALLPGPRMPAAGPPLAGSAAPGPAASGRCGQSPARPDATGAPPTCHICAASHEGHQGCGSAWSRSNNFLATSFVRPAGLLCTAPEVGPQPGTLLLSRLPAGGAQGA